MNVIYDALCGRSHVLQFDTASVCFLGRIVIKIEEPEKDAKPE